MVGKGDTSNWYADAAIYYSDASDRLFSQCARTPERHVRLAAQRERAAYRCVDDAILMWDAAIRRGFITC